ncbi:MAG TPA: serine/threonine-protein kinase [Polyangiaceae bacterium]|nr:serine/threonine-protein kinase [Polyangiaceae bacterium]
MTNSPVPVSPLKKSTVRPSIARLEKSTSEAPVTEQQIERIGRYTLEALIAVGGMASVYLGSSTGAADFTRVVAIKRMHPHFAQDAEFVSRFRDEAWLCARLLHPNIVQTFDVVEWVHELLLIMEYVEGVTLHALRTDANLSATQFPVPVALGVVVPALHGLHAAHEAKDDDGHPLRLVHRDFTPHNLLVSREGHAKVLDFGIAKARGQLHATSTGQLSGKFGYLSPEQIHADAVDRRADIFAAGIMLWETLTGERLFREQGLSDAGVLDRVLRKPIPAPSSINPEVSVGLDAIALKALARDPTARVDTARDFALALEAELAPASPSRVSEFVLQTSGARLARLAELHAGVRRRPNLPPRRLPAALEPADPTIAVLPELTRSRIQSRPRKRALWLIPVTLLAAPLALYSVDRFRGVQRPAPPDLAVSAGGAPKSSGGSVRAPTTPPHAAIQPEPPAIASATPVVNDQPAVVGSGAQKAQSNAPNSRVKVATAEAKRASSKASASKSSAPKPMMDDRCNPPTYVDAKGIRHFKEGCL